MALLLLPCLMADQSLALAWPSFMTHHLPLAFYVSTRFQTEALSERLWLGGHGVMTASPDGLGHLTQNIHVPTDSLGIGHDTMGNQADHAENEKLSFEQREEQDLAMLKTLTKGEKLTFVLDIDLTLTMVKDAEDAAPAEDASQLDYVLERTYAASLGLASTIKSLHEQGHGIVIVTSAVDPSRPWISLKLLGIDFKDIDMIAFSKTKDTSHASLKRLKAIFGPETSAIDSIESFTAFLEHKYKFQIAPFSEKWSSAVPKTEAMQVLDKKTKGTPLNEILHRPLIAIGDRESDALITAPSQYSEGFEFKPNIKSVGIQIMTNPAYDTANINKRGDHIHRFNEWYSHPHSLIRAALFGVSLFTVENNENPDKVGQAESVLAEYTHGSDFTHLVWLKSGNTEVHPHIVFTLTNEEAQYLNEHLVAAGPLSILDRSLRALHSLREAILPEPRHPMGLSDLGAA